eukprot:gene4638-8211_t
MDSNEQNSKPTIEETNPLKRTREQKDSKKNKKKKIQEEENRILTDLFDIGDYSNLKLKQDHENRPLYVCPNKTIVLETFSPVYQQAYDFLVAIAEPISRPELIQEYKLTPYSLFAAVSIGLETDVILTVLDKLSKIELDNDIIHFIKKNTEAYGKVKLVLEDNSFFVQSTNPSTLQRLLREDLIKESRIIENKKVEYEMDENFGFYVHEKKSENENFEFISTSTNTNLQDEITYSFEIDSTKVEKIKERCIRIDLPMTEYYDYLNDPKNPQLDIDLKAQTSTSIRSYQEKCLSKMFGSGRARSGIIVLPCGAGKTLVGITAVSTVKKNTLVICPDTVSVIQWYKQFKLWTNVNDNCLVRWISGEKDSIPRDGSAIVVFTTYSMLSRKGERASESESFMKEIQRREWGLLVMDECHVIPAKNFREVLSIVKAHTKLGLTATLLREDGKEEDLYHLIGPKLYEANWLDLQKQGYLANVQCVEVWCDMTPEFFKAYLETSTMKQNDFFEMNPNKFRACEFLIRYHEARGDKVIVYCDSTYAQRRYAKLLGKPFIAGETLVHERLSVLSQFQFNKDLNTVFISRVGDTAIDIPNASVIIQISSQQGSRRQETQRLGRILRPKGDEKSGFNAFFYSLISRDTSEMYFSTKRQQFLLNQGYSFKTITNLDKIERGQRIKDLSLKDEKDLIEEIKKRREDSSKRIPKDEKEKIKSQKKVTNTQLKTVFRRHRIK